MASGTHKVVDLSDRTLRELESRAPGFPVEDFARAVSAYVESRTPEPTNAAVRDELDEIAGRAIGLCALLGDRSDKLDGLLASREQLHGSPGLANRLIGDLRQLMGIAEMARRDAEIVARTGRTLSRRTKLVADLATALEVAGFEASARPRDRLVNAFGIALEVSGESISDPAGTVKAALRRITGNNGPA